MASKKISSLSHVLSANVNPFVAAISGSAVGALNTFGARTTAVTSKAARAIASMASPIKGAFGSIAGAAGGVLGTLGKFTGIGAVIGGLAGGAGIGLLVNNSLDAIDTNAKLADRLGFTTEALAGLQYAADLSGVSADTLTGGLQKLLKNTAEAAGGNETLSKAFSSLGLDAKALVNQSPEQSFKQIADALNKIENPALKAAAAQEIFGKAGQSLLPLLAEGSDGLAAMTAEAAQLGLTYNRLDAAAVEEANDAISRAKSAFVGFGNSLAVAVAPAILFVANGFTSFGKSVIGVVQTYLPVVVSYTSAIFARLSGVVSRVWTSIYGFITEIAGGIYTAVASRWQQIVAVASQYGVALWGAFSAIGNGIASVWTWAMDLLGLKTQTAGGVTEGAVGGIVSAWTWLLDTVSYVINVVTFGVSNFGTVIAYVLTAGAHHVVKFGNQLSYIFMDVIGGTLVWLASNWREIFSDIVRFTDTVFSNLLTNASNFGKALWSAIKGERFSFEFTPLTEGFSSALSKMPAIAERQIGALEGALAGEAAALGDSLTSGLDKYLADQDAKAKEVAKGAAGIAAGIGDEIAKAGGAGIPKIKTAVPEIDTDDAIGAIDEVGKKSKEVAEGLKLVGSGSAESMQLAAQARADAIKAQFASTSTSGAASPIAAPAGASSVAAPIAAKATAAARDENKLAALLQQMVTLLTTGNGALATIATNTDFEVDGVGI